MSPAATYQAQKAQYSDCLNTTIARAVSSIRDGQAAASTNSTPGRPNAGNGAAAARAAAQVAQATAQAIRNCSSSTRQNISSVSLCAQGGCSQRPAQICLFTNGSVPVVAACNVTVTMGPRTVDCMARARMRGQTFLTVTSPDRLSHLTYAPLTCPQPRLPTAHLQAFPTAPQCWLGDNSTCPDGSDPICPAGSTWTSGVRASLNQSVTIRPVQAQGQSNSKVNITQVRPPPSGRGLSL